MFEWLRQAETDDNELGERAAAALRNENPPRGAADRNARVGAVIRGREMTGRLRAAAVRAGK